MSGSQISLATLSVLPSVNDLPADNPAQAAESPTLHNDVNADPLNGGVVCAGSNCQRHTNALFCEECHPSPVENPPIIRIRGPRRVLTSWDVGSLVFNKMVGTGIFTAPPAVLALLGSGGAAFGLWIGGFLYTIVSMLIYLKFVRRLPYTGGEMIYLDETVPGPPFLVYSLYAIFFVLVYGDATNSMHFGEQVLISATWTGTVIAPATEPSITIEPRMMRFIAVVILSLICMFHYFTARGGRALNQALAFGKFVALLALIGLGGRTVQENRQAGANYPLTPTRTLSNTAAALLLVLFSFQGWENATFVAHEMATYQILKRGFIGAVVCVGCLYLIVNAVFLTAIPYDDVVAFLRGGRSNFAPLFCHDSYRSNIIWAIVVALSAAGNIVSVSYTSSRVKQAIGKTWILPWSSLWESGSSFEPETPKGGLILHWIFSVVFIVASSGIKNTGEAISFPGLLQAYGLSAFGVLISIGFWRLHGMIEGKRFPSPPRPGWTTTKMPTSFQVRIARPSLAILYLGINAVVLGFACIPPYVGADGTNRVVKGWIFAASTGGILLSSIVYYFAVIPDRSGHPWKIMWSIKRWSVIQLTGAQARIEEREGGFDESYGFKRTLQIAFQEDTLAALAANPHPKPQRSLLYWLFGGTLRSHYREVHGRDALRRLRTMIGHKLPEGTADGSAQGLMTDVPVVDGIVNGGPVEHVIHN